MRTLAILVLLLAPFTLRAVTFGEWCGENGIEANAAADPDQDGISNAMEYALDGLDPKRADSPDLLPRMVFGTRAEGSALPWNNPAVITYHGLTPPRTGYWYLGIRYKPRPETEGVRWRPQYAWWASNLAAWLDGRSVFLAPVDAGGGWVIQWMDGMFRPAAPPDNSYVRMRVTLD